MSVQRCIIARFLENWKGDEEEFRTLLTISLFLSDDERINDIALSKKLTHESSVLDEELVVRVLSICSPFEIAATLWGVLGFRLSPGTFQTLFRRAFENTDDVAVFHQLGGAANDYLRHHPGQFHVPEDLSSRLLKSEDVDHRIIGLKLLKHGHLPLHLLVGHFIEALASPNVLEQCGALHEIEEVLDRSGVDAFNSLDRNVVARFLRMLETLARESKETDIGSSCCRIISAMQLNEEN